MFRNTLSRLKLPTLLLFFIGTFSIATLVPHIALAVDDSQIIFTDGGNIFKINNDGTGIAQITTNNASAWGSMTSDHTKIVYANYDANGGNGNIYIMNANGTGQTNLTNASDDSEGAPAVSADGTKVVYMRQDEGNKNIYIMNIDGTGQTQLTTDPAEDNWPAISPDATKVVFTSARDGGPYQVYIMNADGTGQTELASGEFSINEYPSFSPDGTKIIFEKDSVIYTMNIDGSSQTAIRRGGVPVRGTFPTYNADGTKIAYSDEDGGISIMNADGSSPVQVNSYGGYPHFSSYRPISLDGTAPVFTESASALSVTTSGATIGWTTDESASTAVSYGLTSSYGTNTATTDTSPLVTAHSVALSGLLACTTYHYAAVTTDASSNAATSDDGMFTTAGCQGDATPSSTVSTSVTVSSPSTSTLTDSSHILTVETPANFTSSASSVVIQIKGLDSDTVLGSIGKPSTGLASAASIVFDVTALINNTTVLSSFDAPVTISYTYTDADISGLDESSLTMYHYHNGSWLPLTSCSVGAATNTITCNAPSFSTFAIFGTVLATASTSSSSGYVSGGGSPAFVTPSASVAAILGSGTCPASLIITQNMIQGAKDGVYQKYTAATVREVSILQKQINRILAASYNQAAGPTDGIFGALTKQGVQRLQTALNVIVKPTPALKIDGIVGPYTKAAMNNSCGGM